jgi:hypothetical protein
MTRPPCAQSFKLVKRRDIAKELRAQLLVFDDSLGGSLPQWVLKESVSGPLARAFQIDDGHLAVGGQQIDFRCFKHSLT